MFRRNFKKRFEGDKENKKGRRGSPWGGWGSVQEMNGASIKKGERQ